MLLRTAAALFLAVVTGTAAAAEPVRELVCYSTAETRDKIAALGLFDPFSLMRIALRNGDAELVGVKLCRRSEDLVYEIRLLLTNGHVAHVFFDARTGEILGARQWK